MINFWKRIIFLIITLILGVYFVPSVRAASLAKILAGRIVINVESKGEAWYVNPVDARRYYLGRPADAFAVMRQLGLGINEIDFQQIAQVGMSVNGNLELAGKLAGRILLQIEKNGEAWYVNPVDLKKYYLGRPADAFAVMRQLGLGISRTNLARLHKAGLNESLDQYSAYNHEIIATAEGNFTVDMIDINLANPFLRIITDTAEEADCQNNCQAKSLADYVFKHNGFAGINGTYFCDLNGCSAKNYYFYPVFKTATGKMINENQLKWWTTGPIVAFDQNNKFYYFKDSRDFGSVAGFQERYGVKLQAAIGNKPRLIENFMNVMLDWELDAKQLTGKSMKSAFAFRDNHIFLVSVYNVTLAQLASVLKELKMEYALNLDSGGSSAMFYNDEYIIGPGRDIPNAIIFSRK